MISEYIEKIIKLVVMIIILLFLPLFSVCFGSLMAFILMKVADIQSESAFVNAAVFVLLGVPFTLGALSVLSPKD